MPPDLEAELTRTLETLLAHGAGEGSGNGVLAPAGTASGSARASDSATPANLAAAIRYSLLAPGKRIRPRLALACARLVGLSTETALPAALAVEMIHCFTLIHDDLPCMDDDDMRRGRPSNHIVHGEALALLAGDALMMLALEALTLAAPGARDATAFGRALRRFAWASGARGVIGGQAAESLLDAPSPAALPALERMHALKTGALFSAALLLPMDLAGIPDTDPRGQAIARFADALGLAFQIADDLDDAAAEAQDPTNIVAYLPAAEARARTRRRLADATAGLQAAWGAPACAELAGIAHEVDRSLERGPAA